MYENPVQKCVAVGSAPPSEREASEHFEDFYEDVFEELRKFGEVKALNICDNMAEHLSGNVYALFRYDTTTSAMDILLGQEANQTSFPSPLPSPSLSLSLSALLCSASERFAFCSTS